MRPYEPSVYWERLLEDEFNESGVGYPGLAHSVNRAMYRSMTDSVARALKRAGVSVTLGRVLDVGSGTGIWIDFWRRRGVAEITGVDLTATAVEHLRRRWPEYEFLQADVSDDAAGLPRARDIVSAMSVLLHIVDDTRFRRAFSNLAAALRPGGTLVLIEPVIVHRWWGPPFGEEANSRARPLADYRAALQQAGLELEVLQPATVLLANVIDTRSAATFHLMNLYWTALARGVGRRERLGAAVATIVSRADLIALRTARTGPSAKVLVARRVH